MKIIEGSYFNAAINSEGKLVLWTKFTSLNETTIETDIYARDCSFFKPEGSRISFLLIINNDFELITVIPNPDSKIIVQRKDFGDIKVKAIASLYNKPNFYVLKENGMIHYFGSKDSHLAPKTSSFLRDLKIQKPTGFKDIVMTEDTVTALANDGSIVSWGKFEGGNIQVPLKYYTEPSVQSQGRSPILKLFSNKYVTFALKANGSLDGWGNNINKQLDILEKFSSEALITPYTEPTLIPKVFDLALNDSCVYVSWGNPYTIGYKLDVFGVSEDNLNYKLGSLKDKYNYSTKIPNLVVEKLKTSRIENLFGGKDSVYALFSDNSIISWGLQETVIKEFGGSGSEAVGPVGSEAKIFNSIYVPDLFVQTEKEEIERSFEDSNNYLNRGFSFPLEVMIEKVNRKDVSLDDLVLEIKELGAPETLEKQNFSLILKKKGNERSFDSNPKNIIFTIEKEIGSGTYGKVYLIKDSKSKSYVLKVPKISEEMKVENVLSDFYEEALKQIICYEKSAPNHLCGKIICIAQGVSSEETKGPKVGNTGPSVPYIIQEYFPKTLSEYLIETVTQHSPSIKFKKELVFLALVKKLCIKLSSIQDFEFNHRDMKADNIMLTYDGKGHVNDIFLIDFGYSCVNINGYKLGQNTALFGKAKCYRSSRDLSFLIFSIYYTLRKAGLNFTLQTESFIKWLLSFKIKDTVCEPYNGCDYEISSDFNKMDYGTLLELREVNRDLFNQAYHFFDKNYVENPKTNPENLIGYIDSFITFGGMDPSIFGEI